MIFLKYSIQLIVIASFAICQNDTTDLISLSVKFNNDHLIQKTQANEWALKNNFPIKPKKKKYPKF